MTKHKFILQKSNIIESKLHQSNNNSKILRIFEQHAVILGND